MFDFPNAPVVGDTYTSGSTTYVWDGIVWSLESAGTASDYVLRVGDTMTGKLGFGMVAIADPTDLSKHIALYDSPTAPFGFSITTNTINVVSPHTVSFNVAGAERASVKNDGFRVYGNMSVSGSVTANGHFTSNAGADFHNPSGAAINVHDNYIIGVITGGGGSDATSKTYVDTNDGLLEARLMERITKLESEVAQLRAGRR
jgi:hypothetical protein